MRRHFGSRMFDLHDYLDILDRIELNSGHQELLLEIKLIRQKHYEIRDRSSRVASESLAI